MRIGILGYGNLGKAISIAINNNPEMELVAVFTRRNPQVIKPLTKVNILPVSEIEQYINKIDILILCGGSANDLVKDTIKYAKYFNVIDSYDNHAKIVEHFNEVNEVCQKNKKIAIVSCGWDPGLFSLNRLFSQAILPNGITNTFWGPGVSQGHTNAIRKLDGVDDAIQYTIPNDDILKQIRNGNDLTLADNQKHTRVCYVALKDGINHQKITNEIKNMPDYFKEYNTQVNYITTEELHTKHNKMPHGGSAIHLGYTGLHNENKQLIEYSLKLDSNPEFTANIILAYTKALYKLSKMGTTGAKTIFDIPPSLLINKTNEELLKEFL